MNCNVIDCNNKPTNTMKEDYNCNTSSGIVVVRTYKLLCKEHADLIGNYENSVVSIR